MRFLLPRVILILAAQAMLGAECSPSEPACAYAEACAGLVTPMRSCINFCAERWNEVTSKFNRCALDPCDEALLLSGVPLCPSSHRCAPDADPTDGIGRCEPAISNLLDVCGGPDATGPYDQCGSGFVCLASACSQVEQFLAGFRMAPPGPEVCFVPRRAGDSCDSNLADRDLVDPTTGLPYLVGCAPCEYGTSCVPNHLSGAQGPPKESTCLRGCENKMLPDNTLCGCKTSRCTLAAAEPVIDAISGANLGRFFCEPCVLPQNTGCSGGFPCCDGTGCNIPRTANPKVSDPRRCCQAMGESCDGGLADQCCHGAACAPTLTCTLCGVDTDADVSNVDCCRGYYAIGKGASRRCARCSDVAPAVPGYVDAYGNFGCDDEIFSTGTLPTGRDAAFVPNPAIPWPNTFRGTLGGDLVTTAGRVDFAEYALHGDHRAWLLDGTLSAGVGVGTRTLELGLTNTDLTLVPRLDSFAPQQTWQSFRIYDGGSCSLRLGWDALAAVISTQLNRVLARELVTNPLVSGLKNLGVQVGPVLAGTSTGVLGLLEARDRVSITASYSADSLALCNNVSLTLSAMAQIDTQRGYNETAETRRIDAAIAQVGCRRTASGAEMECTLPAGASGGLSTERFVFRDNYYNYPPTRWEIELELSHVGCAIVRGEYRCSVPLVVPDELCDPSVDPDCPCSEGDACFFAGDAYEPMFFVSTSPNRTFVRPLDWVEGSRDLTLSFPDGISVDISDVCLLEPAVVGIVQRSAASQLDRIAQALSGLLAGLLGDSAINNFGFAPSAVPACGLRPDMSLNDDLCHQTTASYAGGRRHACANVSGGFLCDRIRLEPRGVNIRPDGIEIVLAEDASDPQFAILGGRVDPLAPLFSTPTPLCAPNRWSSAQTGPPIASTLQNGVSTRLLFDGGRGFCAPDASACGGICAQSGTTCFQPSAGIAGLTRVPTGARCEAGRCCNVAGACALGP